MIDGSKEVELEMETVKQVLRTLCVCSGFLMINLGRKVGGCNRKKKKCHMDLTPVWNHHQWLRDDSQDSSESVHQLFKCLVPDYWEKFTMCICTCMYVCDIQKGPSKTGSVTMVNRSSKFSPRSTRILNSIVDNLRNRSVSGVVLGSFHVQGSVLLGTMWYEATSVRDKLPKIRFAETTFSKCAKTVDWSLLPIALWSFLSLLLSFSLCLLILRLRSYGNGILGVGLG